MTTFEVTTGELWALAGKMYAVSDALETAARTRRDHAAVTGSTKVDGEISAFFQHWSDGMTKMQKKLDDMAERLVAAAEAYDATEQGISTAAREFLEPC